LERAGRWFLESGIQEASGGVARYYLADAGRNRPVSTEITGYAASTLVYLHRLTGEQEYLDAALRAAAFLTRTAWDAERRTFPFECEGEPRLAYFFDCGIIARGLLSVWRATGDAQWLEAAAACGRSMARDFAAGLEMHPILRLPSMEPLPREPRWSRSPGCYQLKSAMAWFELFEATGEPEFRASYEQQLELALRTCSSFLPGESERDRVMDRLHAYSYFLEGLLPCAGRRACAVAICEGLGRVAGYLREIGPSFARSDVYAQLLRMRCFAAWNGAAPMDREAACSEGAQLAGFQCGGEDRRIGGGFAFGRRGAQWLPHINPVSSGFALQALAVWEQFQAGAPPLHRHSLI
jgi:hypothetical protein